MAYLAGDELAKLVKDGKLLLKPAPRKSLAETGWDLPLRLGRQMFVSSSEDVKELKPEETALIKPGEFALLLTEEWIELPPHVVGFISLKFKWKRKGLANVSGFHVDPFYQGHLVFAVYNAGPKAVPVQRGEEMFMMGLSPLQGSAAKSAKKGYSKLDSDLIDNLLGPPMSVVQLHDQIQQLRLEYDGRLKPLEKRHDAREVIRAQWKDRLIGAGLTLALGAITFLAGYLWKQFWP